MKLCCVRNDLVPLSPHKIFIEESLDLPVVKYSVSLTKHASGPEKPFHLQVWVSRFLQEGPLSWQGALHGAPWKENLWSSSSRFNYILFSSNSLPFYGSTVTQYPGCSDLFFYPTVLLWTLSVENQFFSASLCRKSYRGRPCSAHAELQAINCETFKEEQQRSSEERFAAEGSVRSLASSMTAEE